MFHFYTSFKKSEYQRFSDISGGRKLNVGLKWVNYCFLSWYIEQIIYMVMKANKGISTALNVTPFLAGARQSNGFVLSGIM